MNLGLNGGTGVDLTGLYQQQHQQSNAQQLISNLSHSMGHLQFNPQQQQQQRHHPNSQASIVTLLYSTQSVAHYQIVMQYFAQNVVFESET